MVVNYINYLVIRYQKKLLSLTMTIIIIIKTYQINTVHWKIETESRWKKFRTIKDKLKYFCKNLGQSRTVLKIQDIPGLSRTVGTMRDVHSYFKYFSNMGRWKVLLNLYISETNICTLLLWIEIELFFSCDSLNDDWLSLSILLRHLLWGLTIFLLLVWLWQIQISTQHLNCESRKALTEVFEWLQQDSNPKPLSS